MTDAAVPERVSPEMEEHPDWDKLIVEYGEAVWSVENWQMSGCSSLGEAIRAREFTRTTLRTAIASLQTRLREATRERDEARRDTERLDVLEAAFKDGRIIDTYAPLFTIAFTDASGEETEWGDHTMRAAADAVISRTSPSTERRGFDDEFRTNP